MGKWDRVSGARVLSYAAQMRRAFPCTTIYLSYHSHPIRPRGAPSPRGEGYYTRYHPLKRQHTTLVNLSAPQAPSSRAQPRDLYCTAAICTHTPSHKDTLVLPFSPFPRSRFTALQEGSLYFGPQDTQERRIVSYRFSYRCVELCLFEALYPAPFARAVWPHRKAP